MELADSERIKQARVSECESASEISKEPEMEGQGRTSKIKDVTRFPNTRPTGELKYTYAEHGAMTINEDAPDLIPGVKVELVMPYACGTIHMNEKIHAVRDGEVVDIWPVAGRGKVQ